MLKDIFFNGKHGMLMVLMFVNMRLMTVRMSVPMIMVVVSVIMIVVMVPVYMIMAVSMVVVMIVVVIMAVFVFSGHQDFGSLFIVATSAGSAHKENVK